MAHENNRAFVIFECFFEQFERIDVKVVGGFVKHQKVCRKRKKASQQQSVALASGEVTHRDVCALRRKEKVREVTHDVLAFARDFHPVASRLIVSATVFVSSSCSRS